MAPDAPSGNKFIDLKSGLCGVQSRPLFHNNQFAASDFEA